MFALNDSCCRVRRETVIRACSWFSVLDVSIEMGSLPQSGLAARPILSLTKLTSLSARECTTSVAACHFSRVKSQAWSFSKQTVSVKYFSFFVLISSICAVKRLLEIWIARSLVELSCKNSLVFGQKVRLFLGHFKPNLPLLSAVYLKY